MPIAIKYTNCAEYMIYAINDTQILGLMMMCSKSLAAPTVFTTSSTSSTTEMTTTATAYNTESVVYTSTDTTEPLGYTSTGTTESVTHPSTTITESVRDTTTEHVEPGTVTSTDQESTLKPRPLPHRCSTGVYKKVKMADELLSKIVGSNFTDMQSDGYMQEAQCAVYGSVYLSPRGHALYNVASARLRQPNSVRHCL